MNRYMNTLLGLMLLTLPMYLKAQEKHFSTYVSTGSNYGSALGVESQAKYLNYTLYGSFATGYSALANGSRSLAIGENTKSTGKHSIAMGIGSHAKEYNSVVIGHYSTSTAKSGILLASYANSANNYSFFTGYKPRVTSTNDVFVIGSDALSTNAFTLRKNGYTGIGGLPGTDFLLTVHGNIKAHSLEVLSNVPASDYVFDAAYKLMPIDSLSIYVKKHKCLPEVPTAKDFEANGYTIGKMDDLLLRKVEELSLYVIELENRLQTLQNKKR